MSPHATSHFSQGMSMPSAAGRIMSKVDPVPRLPTPDWMDMRPSGRMTNSPSTPEAPAAKVLSATPTPVTLGPLRRPLRCTRSRQSKSSAPLSIASRANALDACPCSPFTPGAPNVACPSGALTFSTSTWSSPSCFAAFWMIGDSIVIDCSPPGARWAARGGVLV